VHTHIKESIFFFLHERFFPAVPHLSLENLKFGVEYWLCMLLYQAEVQKYKKNISEKPR